MIAVTTRCVHRDDMAIPEDWSRPWLVLRGNTVLLCDTYEIAQAAARIIARHPPPRQRPVNTPAWIGNI